MLSWKAAYSNVPNLAVRFDLAICRSVGRILLARHSPTAGGQQKKFGTSSAALFKGSWIGSIGEAAQDIDSSGPDGDDREDEEVRNEMSRMLLVNACSSQSQQTPSSLALSHSPSSILTARTMLVTKADYGTHLNPSWGMAGLLSRSNCLIRLVLPPDLLLLTSCLHSNLRCCYLPSAVLPICSRSGECRLYAAHKRQILDCRHTYYLFSVGSHKAYPVSTRGS